MQNELLGLALNGSDHSDIKDYPKFTNLSAFLQKVAPLKWLNQGLLGGNCKMERFLMPVAVNICMGIAMI
jgi:hypothetical protein